MNIVCQSTELEQGNTQMLLGLGEAKCSVLPWWQCYNFVLISFLFPDKERLLVSTDTT